MSSLLDSFKRGIQVLQHYNRFLLLVALLFVFPLGILYLHTLTQNVALNNVKTAEKETIDLLHVALQEAVNNNTDFINAVAAYSDTLDGNVFFTLYTSENGEPYTLATTTDTFSVVPAQDFMIETTPSTGAVFIFSDESETHREWLALSKTQRADSSYIIATAHNFTARDQILKERYGSVYGAMVGAFFLLLMIALWMARQIHWQQKHQDLEGRLQSQRMIINTITHEFRAPLTAIAGHLSFLRESNRLRSRDLDSLDKVDLSVDRLRNLVNDFLEVAEIQSGNFTTEITKVNIAEVVQEVIDTVSEQAKVKSIIVRDASRDSNVLLQTDRKRLTQILLNVISNAIKYAGDDDVVVVYEQTPLNVTIRVQDEGGGISARDQKRLFKPFARLESAKTSNTVGSGLGMWITRQLVELLGGTIDIESIKGVGTHVVIDFDMRKIAKKVREGIL